MHKNIGDRRCDPGGHNGYDYNVDLTQFIGPDGMAHLLAHLSAGPLIASPNSSQVKDLDEFVDLFRRLQVPFYEQARVRFDDQAVAEQYHGANEFLPYLPSELQRTATGS